MSIIDIIERVTARAGKGREMPIDWKSVFEKVVVGLIVAVIGGVAVLFWNWGSSGGLVRILGGVTLKELADEVAKHPGLPGPVGPPGPAGASAEIPDGAVIAFDQPGGCPKGWNLVTETIGAAIVGASAPRPGEYDLGRVTNGYPEGGTYHDFSQPLERFSPGTPEQKPKQQRPNTGNAYVYADEWGYKIRTSQSPIYLPLFYCKKGQ